MGSLGFGYLSIGLATSAHGALYVVLGLYLRYRGLAVSDVGWVFTCVGLFQFLARFPAGVVYRAAKAPTLIALGTAAMAVALVGLSFTASRWGIYSMAALFGAGVGFATAIHLAAFVAAIPNGGPATPHMGWYTASLSAGYTFGNLTGGFVADLIGLEKALGVFSTFAIFAAVAGFRLRPDARRVSGPVRRANRPSLADLRSLGGPAIAASLVAVYIGFVNEMLEALFPLHAIDIGMSNTAIGTLKAVRSGSATAIRLASGFLVTWFKPSGLNDVSVAVLGAATIPLVYVQNYTLLALFFLLFGLSRGLLRVTSTTLAAEASVNSSNGGIASMVYHGALDFGTLLGPLLGGMLASRVGVPRTFVIATVTLTGLYSIASIVLRRQTDS